MKVLRVLIFCLLQACQSTDTTLIIQESYVNDSRSKGEAFKETYLKLRFPRQDSLLARLAFPFKVTYKLNNRDWKTENFLTLEAFRESSLFNSTIKDIKGKMPYDESYRTTFADLTVQGQQLKIIQKQKDLGFRFISKNGRWFLIEYSESLTEF
jgi:hypothetical protein